MSEQEHAADLTEFPREIGRPAARALIQAGFATWAVLSGQKRADVAALHGVGPKAMRELDEGLDQRGLGWVAG